MQLRNLQTNFTPDLSATIAFPHKAAILYFSYELSVNFGKRVISFDDLKQNLQGAEYGSVEVFQKDVDMRVLISSAPIKETDGLLSWPG